jgi:hypothetical protein
MNLALDKAVIFMPLRTALAGVVQTESDGKARQGKARQGAERQGSGKVSFV